MRESRGNTPENIEKLHKVIADNPAIGVEGMAHELGWHVAKFQYLFGKVRHEYIKVWQRKSVNPVNPVN